MFTAKTKIAFALSGVVTCLLIASKMLGVVPERGKAVMNGRAKLCESIAITGSILLDQTTDAAHLETALIGIVKRNPDLLSAGLRDEEQNYLVSTKSHDSNWTLADDESSNERCMFVPLFGASGRIGRLELCFTPIVNNRVASFIDADVGTLILFVGPCTFLAFSFVLGLVLKQLDPSGAVPKRVVEALDSLAEGLLIIDVRDRVLLANQAFGNVIGVDSEKLIGYRAARLGWLANGEPLREETPWQEALAAERPVSNRPLQLQGKDGLLRSFVVNASPVVTGSDGKFRGVLVTFDDVTTLEQKKVELGEAKDAAETANRAKSEFLANMSHEIRTPMNAILGFTDVLRRGLEDDQNKRLKYLDTIHSSGSHLIELINDILDLSKIEAGKLELEISAASPYQIMSEVVDVLKVRAEQKGIYLRRTIDGQIPESIQTDSTRLRQVFTNIIGNAIKFTEQGGVELICCFDPSQTDSIEFKVVDTGIGMTQQQAERIFNPFEQADSSVTRRFGGTGLGLSISKRFAEALGGHISVTSEPGKGSVFSIKISTGVSGEIGLLDEASAEKLLDERRQDRSSNLGRIQLPPASILLVDDGESNREFLCVVLRQFGLTATEAENGQVAVDAVENSEFDLIFMDMQMPVMDGYTATRVLRDRGLTIPIVALTANAMQEDEKKCRDAGCDGFLAKPVDVDKLAMLLKDRLGGTEAPDDGTNQANQQPRRFENAECPRMEANDAPIYSTLPTDDALFRPIVSKFIESLPPRLELMCDAFDSRDFDELAQQAHWLKGAGGTVGFDMFTEPAKEFEKLAQDCREDELAVVLGEIIEMASRIRLEPVDNASTMNEVSELV